MCVARESIGALPAFAGSDVEITGHDGSGGRIIVTVSLAKAIEAIEGVSEVVDRLLSGFPFDHRIVFRNEEAHR